MSAGRTMIVSRDEEARREGARAGDGAFVVTTPLDMIASLESEGDRIALVVLLGAYAHSRELARFLAEFYPRLQIVDGVEDVA